MPPKPRYSREYIVALVKKHGYDGKAIIREMGWNRGQLAHRLRVQGVTLMPTFNLHTDEELQDAINKCDSIATLCKYLNVTRARLLPNLKLRGLSTGYIRIRRTIRSIPTPVLTRMYQEVGYSVQKLADQLGFNKQTVLRGLRNCGIERHRGRTVYPWSAWELHQLHHVQGFSTWGIGELYGAGDRSVRYTMQRWGIPLRKDNKNDGRVPTERPTPPLTDEAWDATPRTNA